MGKDTNKYLHLKKYEKINRTGRKNNNINKK